MLQHSATRLAALALCAAGIAGCAYAPPRTASKITRALPPAPQGALETFTARVSAGLAQGESAYWLLARNDSALSARLALTDEAVSTLDVQYFIWQHDATSKLLLRRLVYAADRGVRVRFLLDDLARPQWDAELAALDRHPNIEVRVFNPWRVRGDAARFIEYLLRMRRLNHRMHNKAFIADNRLAIIGGRNIGNRYFGLSRQSVHDDLDTMIAGPLVPQISGQFDRYWNSAQSYPLGQVIRPRSTHLKLRDVIAGFDRAELEFDKQLSEFPLEPTSWNALLDRWADSYTQGVGELYYDSPSIAKHAPTQLRGHFERFISRARKEVLISSPYFIPDRHFLDELAGLVRRGVKVAVITNSLASNNHVVAHVGYRPWRRKILRAGVMLYETRPDAATIRYYSTPPVSGAELELHTKAVVVDGRYSFLGSPNVDPRSLRLNTEIGIAVDDRALAARLRGLILRDTRPRNSWRVSVTDDNWLHWTSGDETLTRQPARGFGQRVLEFFMNMLPLKAQG